MKTVRAINVTASYWELAKRRYPNQLSGLIDQFLMTLALGTEDLNNDYELEELREEEKKLKEEIREQASRYNQDLINLQTKIKTMEAQAKAREKEVEKEKEEYLHKVRDMENTFQKTKYDTNHEWRDL